MENDVTFSGNFFGHVPVPHMILKFKLLNSGVIYEMYVFSLNGNVFQWKNPL